MSPTGCGAAPELIGAAALVGAAELIGVAELEGAVLKSTPDALPDTAGWVSAVAVAEIGVGSLFLCRGETDCNVRSLLVSML